MWTLALSISWLAISLWLRDRKVEPPTIGIAAGVSLNTVNIHTNTTQTSINKNSNM